MDIRGTSRFASVLASEECSTQPKSMRPRWQMPFVLRFGVRAKTVKCRVIPRTTAATRYILSDKAWKCHCYFPLPSLIDGTRQVKRTQDSSQKSRGKNNWFFLRLSLRPGSGGTKAPPTPQPPMWSKAVQEQRKDGHLSLSLPHYIKDRVEKRNGLSFPTHPNQV